MSQDKNILPHRWVVFDTETTGTTPSRDKIVSFGAVAIQGLEIVPEDSFECVIRIPFNSSSVVVHGITKEQSQREGIEEFDAIKQFSEYVGDACLVGHHVDFDVIVVNHARVRHGMSIMGNGSIDLMRLVLALEEAGAIPVRENPHDFSLDGLLEQYGVGKADRHTATGDSFLTAMVFLQLIGMNRTKYSDLINNTIGWDVGLGNKY